LAQAEENKNYFPNFRLTLFARPLRSFFVSDFFLPDEFARAAQNHKLTNSDTKNFTTFPQPEKEEDDLVASGGLSFLTV
jgi:hypothetical protein